MKNYLLHRAELEGDDIADAYQQYWSLFDRDATYWRKKRGTGHARRARIDTFLQHYLTARTAEEVATTRLFATYREFAEAQGGVRAKDAMAILARYAATYRSFEEFPEGGREAMFFSRLGSLDATTMYPLLLELFSSRATKDAERTSCIATIESFLVRRMVCGLSTRGYNRLGIDLLKALRAGQDAPLAALQGVLLQSNSESGRWPDDKEFKAAWLATPIYREQRKKRVRMLLLALEEHLRGSKTEAVVLKKLPTIEHILPRKWQKHWPLPPNLDPQAVEAATETRDGVLHTLGNLTLLTRALNSSQQNSPWAEKRTKLSQHSVLALNLAVRDEPTWEESRIRARGETLFQVARALWPHPTLVG